MTIRQIRFIAVVLATVPIFGACAPTFSKQALERVEKNITFRELQADPDRYKGQWVQLAGVIIQTRNTQEGTILEVLQTSMDRQGRPREADTSEGRFMITSPEFLDSAVYNIGKNISVIGEVAGRKIQPIGEIQYQYPLISAREIQLWEPRTGPQFSFGIGLGVFHRF